MRRNKWKLHNLSILIVSLCFLVYSTGCEMISPSSDKKEEGESYGVSSSNPLAVDAGMKVLKNGGNAVDAAIAVSYVLGVVEPYGSGIGGGGGMMIVPGSGEAAFIDYRETSPSSSGKGVSGVPGLVAGMQYAHDKYGSINMKDLLQPAVDYAENGFEINKGLSSRLESAKSRVYSEDTDLFYPNGNALEEGEVLVQEELAETLKTIQQEGITGFYEGSAALGIKETAGISLEDISTYKVKERQPVQGTYAGYDVYTAPPPFSGAALLQMLKLAEELNLKESPSKGSYAGTVGAIKEVVYQDRIKHIADDVDAGQAQQLVENSYIETMKNKIETKAGMNKDSDTEEHESTTHFVVIDKDGTVVSATNTLSNFFGSGEYTNGFFLNNQLQNFGKGINEKEPHKRPRTFTAPTVLKNGEEVIGIGSAGGNRIPQILMQAIYSYTAENERSFQKIINRYRFVFDDHTIYTEAPFSEKTTRELENQGYVVVHKVSPMYYGGVQLLVKNNENNRITGAGDPRRNGSWKAAQ